MTDNEKSRLLAVRAAFLTRQYEAAEVQLLGAEEVAAWLSEEDSELRQGCLEEAMRIRTGGTRLAGLLESAKAVYLFAKAGEQSPSAEAVADRRSRRGKPREVRFS